ncbi:MAG: hypothetical protein AB1757_23705 [Acidobacteriota bacterium]
MTPPSQVLIEIATQSQAMNYNTPAQVPKITLNGTPIPSPGYTPNSPTGYQIVVINSSQDYTNPASILINEYLMLFPQENTTWWSSTYQYMYAGMLFQQLNGGNIEQQLILLASYGLDNNMPPSNDAYQMLLGLGAGATLQNWETHCDAGSMGGPMNWVNQPANYLFVGMSNYGYGEGYEKQETGESSIVSTLSVTLQNPV